MSTRAKPGDSIGFIKETETETERDALLYLALRRMQRKAFAEELEDVPTDRFADGRAEELERCRRNGLLVRDGVVWGWPQGWRGALAAWPIPFCYFRLADPVQAAVTAWDGKEPAVREFFFRDSGERNAA